MCWSDLRTVAMTMDKEKGLCLHVRTEGFSAAFACRKNHADNMQNDKSASVVDLRRVDQQVLSLLSWAEPNFQANFEENKRAMAGLGMFFARARQCTCSSTCHCLENPHEHVNAIHNEILSIHSPLVQAGYPLRNHFVPAGQVILLTKWSSARTECGHQCYINAKAVFFPRSLNAHVLHLNAAEV